MKKYTIAILAAAVLRVFAFCSKETAMHKDYYGTIDVAATISSDADGFTKSVIDGTDTIEIPLGTPYGAYVAIGKPQRVVIRETGGKNRILGDTTVTLARDEHKYFRFAYVEEAGINQFYESLIAGDSARVFLKNNFDPAYPVIDVYVVKQTDTTLATGLVGILENLHYGVAGYPASIKLLTNNADGSSVRYLAKLMDKATGLFVVDKAASKPRDYVNLGISGGQYFFMTVDGYNASSGRFLLNGFSL